MPQPHPPPWALALALALSLAAALSLGITRFSYGLLLPPMRADLGWSYTLAGTMNTANALGYLLGALSVPALLRRWGAGRLLLGGAVLASLFMAGSGFFVDAAPLLLQRLFAGVCSAWVFVAGGLLAARLGTLWPTRSGLLLGLYYGGVGWGIVASALGVPWLLQTMAAQPHAWAWAWWGLALLCVLATLVLAKVVRVLAQLDAAHGAASAAASAAGLPPVRVVRFAPALVGYGLFGLGYIGYITFVIALLRDQGLGNAAITWFYSLLGLAVVASSRIWAGLLDRHKDGQALARLNALLGLAIVIPGITSAWPALLASGVLFGAVFLSVVASTTAWVRHNLPAAQWPTGVSAFTIAFAVGQISGPTWVGWVADGPGGLQRGLLLSALALWLGALSALRQRALVE